MFNEKLVFRIYDRGIQYHPRRDRFVALGPDINRAFRSRDEASRWLLHCYSFYCDLYGFPLSPAPNFQLADSCTVEVVS